MRQVVSRSGVILVLVVTIILGFSPGGYAPDITGDKVAALSAPVLEIQTVIGGTGYINMSCKVLSDGGHNLTSCGIQVRLVGGLWAGPSTGSFSSDKVFFQATKSGLDSRTIYEAQCYVSYLVNGLPQKAYTEIIQVMTKGAAGLRDLTVVSTTSQNATFSINIIDDGNAPPIMKVEFIVHTYPGGEEATRISKIDTNGYLSGVHTLTTYNWLTPNTEYQVSVWVTNSFSPTSAGPVRFKTLPLPPVVSTSTLLMTLPAANNTYNATMRGTVSSDNGDPVSERGFVHGTSSTPTLVNSKKVTMGTGTGTYSATANGLNYNIRYYYRAYATNRGGTAYGEIRSVLKTPPATPAPSATPTPTIQPRPTVSPTPTIKPRPTVSPTPPTRPSPSPTPTKQPAMTATPSPSPAQATPSPGTSPAPTVPSTPAASASPSASAASPSPAQATASPQATPTLSPSGTPATTTTDSSSTGSTTSDPEPTEQTTGTESGVSTDPSATSGTTSDPGNDQNDVSVTSSNLEQDNPEPGMNDLSENASGSARILIWVMVILVLALLGGGVVLRIRKRR